MERHTRGADSYSRYSAVAPPGTGPPWWVGFEPQEGKKRTEEPVMAERHSKQSRFAGSIGRSPYPKRRRVSDESTLRTISAGGCWCGGPANHTWPGHDQGAPHPREEWKEEWSMAEEELQDRIEERSLRKWDRDVRQMIMMLVNQFGVKHRIQKDGVHIMLYPPDGSTRPFKAAASRPPKTQMRYLERFAQEHVPASIAMASATRNLAAVVNDPIEHPVREEQPVSTAPQEVTQAGLMPPETEDEAVLRAWEGTQTWVPHIGSNRQPTSWLTNGRVFKCIQCMEEGKLTIVTKPRGTLGGHIRTNHFVGTPLWDAQFKAKSKARRRATMAKRRAEREAAATAAAEAALDQAMAEATSEPEPREKVYIEEGTGEAVEIKPVVPEQPKAEENPSRQVTTKGRDYESEDWRALRHMARRLGREFADPEKMADLQAKLAEARAERDAAVRERDDLRAKFELAKEAFGL